MSKLTPEQALISLSSLAADFKVGIVSDDYVRELLTAIVDSMQISDPDSTLKRSLSCWFIED